MKLKLAQLLLIFIGHSMFAQADSLTNLNSKCEFDAYKAQIDIKNGQAKLLLIGGFAPRIFMGQEKFESKYKVKYHDFGCLAIPLECLREYNKVIAEDLDKKYGQVWRKEVRTDVKGIY